VTVAGKTDPLPPPIERPRAILFDWDNTLVDNWASIVDALNTTFRAIGHPTWTEAQVRARARTSARDSFPAVFGERWEEAAQIFYERFESAHLRTLTPLPGADAMLKSLSGAGFYLGVVSNKRGDLLRKEAEQLGWDGLFGRIVGADDAVRDKPSPAPIHQALEPSGIAAGPSVWYVGDALIDIECARNAGCIAVLIGDGHGAETAEAEPDLAFPDCAALAMLIARA